MNAFVRLMFLLSVVLVAGCESTSFSDRLRARFSAAPAQVETYDVNSRDAYFAAQAAFKRLDYQLLKSDLGRLQIEAGSRINRSPVFRDSRQLIALVEIVPLGPDRSEVSLRLREQLEGDDLGGPSELPLKEHGFYQTYFAVLKQVVKETPTTGRNGEN